MDKEWKAGLGTLSRLPFEVRRKIYDFLMRDNCRKHFHRTFYEIMFKSSRTLIIDGIVRYDRYEAKIFDYRLHNGDCGNQCCTSRSLRLQHTSSALRNEYRDNLLASTWFQFSTPAGAIGFMISLTPHEKLQVRRLTLNVSERRDLTAPGTNNGYDRYLQWKWVCSSLPPNLTSVVLDTSSRERFREYMRFKHPRDEFEDQPLIEVFRKLQCALLTTEVICRETKKTAPKAKIQLGLCHPNYIACFHAVMAEYN